MNVVQINEVTKTFGDVTAVDQLSLQVPAGCIYGFIGPNGSGKTTTLRMIMNIFYPDRGSIRVFGQQTIGASTDRIGYLPEERGLYKKMNVRELLLFYGQLKNGAKLGQEIDDWLKLLDLSAWAEKKVETLSKGMSQKVQFIATVLTRPELIILDEPFAGLDPVNADIIRNQILKLQTEGSTVIFSTHDMSVAEKMCDFIFMIFKGGKVLDGTLTEIQNAYGRDTVQLSCPGGVAALGELDDVEKITDHGRRQELRLTPDGDPQKLLATILARTEVTSFEIAQPSLHDIFIQIAGPQAEEANNA